MINDEEAPNESEKGLDNTEDTSRQETSARTGDSDRLEESRRVVVDCVDTEEERKYQPELSSKCRWREIWRLTQYRFAR